MYIKEPITLLLIIFVLILSEVLAYRAWKDIKSQNSLKSLAYFLYAVHLLSYVVIAGFILNFAQYDAATKGSNDFLIGQLGLVVIAVMNFGTSYCLYRLKEYLKSKNISFARTERSIA